MKMRFPAGAQTKYEHCKQAGFGRPLQTGNSRSDYRDFACLSVTEGPVLVIV